jgi:predicted 3-demethylubiquinone-9 3-methyltransferase (glyoxalase superfamily)
VHGPERRAEFKHREAFSFQIAIDDQAETDKYWHAIVGNGGAASQCDWCRGLFVADHAASADRRARQGGDVAKRAFDAMMTMGKIDVAKIEAAVKGEAVPSRPRAGTIRRW